MATLEKLKQDVEDFLTDTEEARILSERDRDYKDHKQWTFEEQQKIESRGQAAVTRNRIKPKVEGLKGLLIQRKTDPKAWPRTPKHEKAAEVVTDGLRYIADNNDFDKVKLENAENVFVEGYGAIISEVIKRGDDFEIINTAIPWDRYYFDTHSRRLDFADKRWDGIIIWMDADDVKQAFKLNKKQMEDVLDDSNMIDGGEETFDDHPQWVDRDEDRVRVCQHFFIEKGVWQMAYFTHSMFLEKQIPSPYLDEYGEPTNPIESVCANIDRDNNRFGEVRYWIDLQDVINHASSKYVHTMNQRQTMGRKGSIPDIPALKRELSKPDGHVEYEGEKGDFEIIKTQDMAEAQFTMYNDAKGELDAVGFNAQLSGERQGDLSGKAITNLQQAATNELSSLYAGLTDLEKRVYRQNWMRMKQFWKEEKWLRIIDDTTKLRWVGFNQKIKRIDQLREQAEDESIDLEQRTQVALQLQQMMQAQDPRLEEIVEIRNDIAELDVDIIIETSYDSINIQRDQFELLGKIAQTRPDVPFTEVLKLSELRSKDKVIKSIEESAQAQQEANSKQQQVVDQAVAADTQETQSKAALNAAKIEAEKAKARKANSDADLTELQAEILVDTPPADASVVL